MSKLLNAFFLMVCAFNFTGLSAEIIYQNDFDALDLAHTEYYPGQGNQDNWFREAAIGDAYGEIQNDIAMSGAALHEHTAISNSSGQQTIDKRELTVYDLSSLSELLVLSVDFYAKSSDYDTANTYSASFRISGGPHPGFEIIGFSLYSGNGTLKSESGVNITIGAFNGADNNMAVPLTVGQNLAWEQWHSVIIVLDQQKDRYVSISVDDQNQSLGDYQLPRNCDGDIWLRGQLIESMTAEIVPSDSFDAETDDDIYWDNVALYTQIQLPDYVTIYQTDFNDFSQERTQWHPGVAGHNGWYKIAAVSPAYDEFQSAVAHDGVALHQYTDSSSNPGSQTIDAINLPDVNLTDLDGVLAFSFDFYASSSDLSKTNPYIAGLSVQDSTHPGYVICKVGINAGNGMPKNETGIFISLGTFNGLDNNEPVPLSVGRQLAWDQWHSVTLLMDYSSERYDLIVVDGQSQELDNYLLPRTEYDGQWLRSTNINTLLAELVPAGESGNRSDDHIYYDNILLKTQRPAPQTIYLTGFDNLDIGQTIYYPGNEGQDGWYRESEYGDGYGEIQNLIAKTANALHEHAAISQTTGQQTIDRRNLEWIDMSATEKLLKLSLDFYAHSSDYDTANNYSASFALRGGPHPGYTILDFALCSGNGPLKSDAGVNVAISGFNGLDNNEPIPLSIGQHLAWDTWHSISIILDHHNDCFKTITVDGQTQDISAWQPVRTFYEDQWLRGQQLETIIATIVPFDSFNTETDDDVYWDNLSIQLASTDQDIPSLENPQGLQAAIIDQSVELTWEPISDPYRLFGHYAIYRADNPFEYVYGKTPIATISPVDSAQFTDNSVEYSEIYYYAITTVAIDGTEGKQVNSCIGPIAPRHEDDLQMLTITRTPYYARYHPVYTEGVVAEPGGLAYICSRATALQDQDETTRHWPELGETMTYTARIRNRGTTIFNELLQGTWRLDNTIHSQPVQSVTLAPGDIAQFPLQLTWDNESHDISFTIDYADEIAENNCILSNTLSVGYMTYIDQSYYDRFRDQWSPQWPGAQTADLVDWLNRHMKHMNEMLAAAGCQKRVHYDVLEILPDGSPIPAEPAQINFAIFPLHYETADMEDLHRGYYDPDKDISYALIHEMAHQLGMIDLYQLSFAADNNAVNHWQYQPVSGIMSTAAGNQFSRYHALAMNHWLKQPHGYYGQFMYCLPQTIQLRIIDHQNQPISGATVNMFQYLYWPDGSYQIKPLVKAQGITNNKGIWQLPNVPIDPAIVPEIPTGDHLHDNPFGYIHVVGQNTVLLFQIIYNGGVDYCWLDVTEANIAYWEGQTDLAIFERKVALSDTTMNTMPMDLAEANAGQWHQWRLHPELDWISIQDDFEHKLSGNTSIKISAANESAPTGMNLRYPAEFNANWNLSSASRLHFSVYSDTAGSSFVNSCPIIRLQDPDGNYYQYQYYIAGHGFENAFNQTIGHWIDFDIPLDASAPGSITGAGWSRVSHGSPDLSRIECLEMAIWLTEVPQYHVWLDNVYFDWPQYQYLDFNGSGLVDISDLSPFIASWLNHDLTYAASGGADLTMDHNVTMADILLYMNSYLTGSD